MKRVKILLWLCLCIFMISSAVTVQAEDSGRAFSSEESYLAQTFQKLYQANDLEIPTGITVSENSAEQGILLTGSSSVFETNRISIRSSYTFSGNRVGRVAINALAAYGENLTVKLYLDDEKESFASFNLKKQGRDNLWTKNVCLQKDVLANNIQGSHTISFSVENADGGKTALLLRSIEFAENSIPTIYMNLDESLGKITDMKNSKDASAECYGDMTLQVAKGYHYEFGQDGEKIASQDRSDKYDLSYMRISPFDAEESYIKGNYNIRLNQKASLLGMRAGRNWILQSNNLDNSKLRNQLGLRMGRDLGMDLATECAQVELVINGVYEGCYLLINDSLEDLDYRLTLTETDATLLKENFQTKQLYVCVEDTSDYDMAKRVSVSEIESEIMELEDALDTEGSDYSGSMDLTSAAMCFLIEEISRNECAFDALGVTQVARKNGKIYWGPLARFQQYCMNYYWDDEYIDGYSQPTKGWFRSLMKNKAFVAKMEELWPKFKAILEGYSQDGGVIDQYYEQIEIALRYDQERWGILDPESHAIDVTGTYTSEGDKNKIKYWTEARSQWLDGVIQSSELTPIALTFMADDQKIAERTITRDTTLNDVPEAPAKEGYIFQRWEFINEYGDLDSLSDFTTFAEDTTLTAIYVAEADAVQPENIYLDYKEMWVPIAENDYSDYEVHARIYPMGAVGEIAYISSDESILKVDPEVEGALLGVAEGDATVTVTYGNLKASCLVHVYDPAMISYPEGRFTLKESSISLKLGQRQQLTLQTDQKEYLPTYLSFRSLNESIASVDSCGVVCAEGYGTTYILLSNEGKITTCKVTIAKPSTIKKGSSYTYKGLKYKVTYKASKGGNVTVTAPTKKTIKTVSIPSTVKIKGETFKVTAISSKAFYKCTKLSKITLGNNLKSIGNNAFTKIYKKAVFKVPSSKLKAYKKLLTSKKGYRKTMKIKK